MLSGLYGQKKPPGVVQLRVVLLQAGYFYPRKRVVTCLVSVGAPEGGRREHVREFALRRSIDLRRSVDIADDHRIAEKVILRGLVGKTAAWLEVSLQFGPGRGVSALLVVLDAPGVLGAVNQTDLFENCSSLSPPTAARM